MSETLDARFERLLAREGPALRRLAAAYADSGEVDDLFQDICFAIWKALPGFRAECSERSFVFRIGHNRGISWRGRRRLTLPLQEAVEAPDHRPLPDEEAMLRQRRARLLAAVRRLPELARQVILLSLEGLSGAEIAQVLGITENNVGVRLTRARAALRALLQAQGEW